MIDMGGLDFGARYLLGIALANNNLKLAEWLLSHGTNPNPVRKPGSKFPPRSLHEEALQQGFTEIADILAYFGAIPSAPAPPEREKAFTAACFHLDPAETQAILAMHPEYLRSPTAMFAAAQQDRADVLAFLPDLGMSVEIEDEHKQRPLHKAASHNSLRVAALLIERRAEIDPVEYNWGVPPLALRSTDKRRK
jgi:uncharacterized protein